MCLLVSHSWDFGDLNACTQVSGSIFENRWSSHRFWTRITSWWTKMDSWPNIRVSYHICFPQITKDIILLWPIISCQSSICHLLSKFFLGIINPLTSNTSFCVKKPHSWDALIHNDWVMSLDVVSLFNKFLTDEVLPMVSDKLKLNSSLRGCTRSQQRTWWKLWHSVEDSILPIVLGHILTARRLSYRIAIIFSNDNYVLWVNG